eukprot:TRINITY_DN20913_c1_g1_i1.p1 TRINITY_DN20913_c1_g1~~TRINITY_DN20913_c1_g1_i1.p1  ORF type:complete len:454 (-),score=86.18 TRINITY_DN20913_c1_g1_i1:104-1465(-)
MKQTSEHLAALLEALRTGNTEGLRGLASFCTMRNERSFAFEFSETSPWDADESMQILSSADLDGLAEYIEMNDPRNIVCLVGAGLSTAAGIPDFRSPGTGLYQNLQRYDLPEPESVFDLDFFRESPDAFYDLAKELWPTGERYRPTKTHYFLRMLEQQGRLRRCYTQNIDMLEQLAGLSEDKVIAAHGNFAKAHTLSGQEVDIEELRDAVFQGVEACKKLSETYGSLVKPDIVFFGEDLPRRFHEGMQHDFHDCDLLIVLGTSLAVAPFNKLISMVPPSCPRVLMNREIAGLASDPFECAIDPTTSRVLGGFRFHARDSRDIFLQCDCDEGVQQLCGRVGWAQALDSACQGMKASWQKCLPAPPKTEFVAKAAHGTALGLVEMIKRSKLALAVRKRLRKRTWQVKTAAATAMNRDREEADVVSRFACKIERSGSKVNGESEAVVSMQGIIVKK